MATLVHSYALCHPGIIPMRYGHPQLFPCVMATRNYSHVLWPPAIIPMRDDHPQLFLDVMATRNYFYAFWQPSIVFVRYGNPYVVQFITHFVTLATGQHRQYRMHSGNAASKWHGRHLQTSESVW